MGILYVAFGLSVGHERFEFFTASGGRWCGVIGEGGLDECVGREGVADAIW